MSVKTDTEVDAIVHHVIVIIACGFDEEGVLCETAQRRIDAALQLEEQIGRKCSFIATGDVPYKKGSKTLAELIANEIVEYTGCKHNHKKPVISKGNGIFSEAKATTEYVAKMENIRLHIVSSNWYFWPGQLIWEDFAQNNHVDIDFVPIKGAVGVKTRIVYSGYALAANIAHLLWWLGARRAMEWLMNRIQAGRKNGFTSKGCD